MQASFNPRGVAATLLVAGLVGGLGAATAAAMEPAGHEPAVAELRIGTQDAVMTLVLPTGWVAFADDDGNGSLSDAEIAAHADELARRLGLRIWLVADVGRPTLVVAPPRLPPARLDLATDGRHSTLALDFRWHEPVGPLAIHYDLFTPGVASERCLMTVLRDDSTATLEFSQAHPELAFDGRSRGHRFAMAVRLLGREHGLEVLGVALMLGGLAYGVWVLARGFRPRRPGEQGP